MALLRRLLSVMCVSLAAHPAHGQQPPVAWDSAMLQVGGVFPSLTTQTESGLPRSECGHGAMIAWADRLWLISYLSVPNSGAAEGTGLFAIDQNMNMTRVASHNSVYANRMMHPASDSVVIGPYVISATGVVRTITGLLTVRIGGMAQHLTDAGSVYMLGMDGPLWSVNLATLEVVQLFDLVTALQIPASEQPHFKAAHTMGGKLYVASNTFQEDDFIGAQHGGRLATWDGKAENWTILERTAFTEVAGRHNFGCVVFALGWDDASVILKVIDTGCDEHSYDTSVQTYRLPKASHTYDHLWTTEWPRIREVETERYLMDMHGTFFELPPLTWGGAAWGTKPVAQHLRMVPDFAAWRGMLVLGGNQVSSIFDNNWVTGQSQAGLWFGKTDDLWSFGKPQGWGGPWRYDIVNASSPSDPYLMTGYDKKVAHFRSEYNAAAPNPVRISIQVDFTGSAGHRAGSRSGANFMERWNTVAVVGPLATDVQEGSYAYYVFEPGFSAHWVRFVVDQPCNCTAWLTYT